MHMHDRRDSLRDGFSGTIPAFLDWLGERLQYGGVVVDEPQPAETDEKKLVRQVRLITGGWSDDEHLLGRITPGSMPPSLFGLMFWTSTHRGELFVYEVPVERFDSPQELTWLDPETDVFEQLHRVREVVVRTPQDDEISVAMPHGAQLSFVEPHRDVNEPAGVLVIAPIEGTDDDPT